MDIGTANAKRGAVDRGVLRVTSLPTGAGETLPIVLVNGTRDGPTVWITAGVHGDEATGIAAAQDAVAATDPDEVRGSIVCCPIVNPAGLRRNERSSYYHDEDPNRQFPDADRERIRPPTVQELIADRLYETITESATALLDLHTAQVNSMPFVIRDRVLYGSRREEAAAEDLATDLGRLVEATGLPVVNEYPAEEYVDQLLHRSLAGSILNDAGIPACTLELGSCTVVEETGRAAGVAAVHRVLVELGVQDSVPPAVAENAPAIDSPTTESVRRYVGPHTDEAGLVRHRVEVGEAVHPGTPVADVVTPTGEQLTTVESDDHGYVLARQHGLGVYENDPVTALAVEDDGDLVVPRERS